MTTDEIPPPPPSSGQQSGTHRAHIDGASTTNLKTVIAVLTILVTLLVGGVGGLTMARADLGFLDRRMDSVEQRNDAQDTALGALKTNDAVQDERWNTVVRRLNEIAGRLDAPD
ncbi:MAG: hypothetical protein JJ863_21300 [Deltaproteobacteria bacterium]|nr:hypothetical protein [Deltaproteobacteria bacterium]